MFRKLLLLLGVGFALFTACTDANPTDFAGVTTESNDFAEKDNSGCSSSGETTNGTVVDNIDLSSTSPASSASAVVPTSSVSAVVPTSSTAQISNPLTEAELAVVDSILSSLDESYTFKTSAQIYYSQSQCMVSLYENECGVQLHLDEYLGNFLETSLVLEDKNVLLQMVDNNYRGGDIVNNCRTDSLKFQQNCEMKSGVFRNYGKGSGCESVGGTLQIACAMRLPENAVTLKLLTNEAENYKQKCEADTIAVSN